MNYSKQNTIRRQRSMNSAAVKIEHKAGVSALRIFLLCLVALFVCGLAAGFGAVKGILDASPALNAEDVAPTGFSSTVYNSDGAQIQKLVGSDANRIYVDLDQIPEDVQNAFIAIEDKRFWDHNGIDVEGIFRAAIKGLTSGDFDSGASTLTQQLIKNQLFNGGHETEFVDKVKRKIQEQYLAVKLEKELSKNQILEYYLNTINLGQNTLGVQAASLRYFNKSVSDLTLSEATVIAGITQNPTWYNPINYPDHNADRRKIILDDMVDQGYITEAQKTDCLNDDVYSRILKVNDEVYTNTTTSVNSWFVDATIDQVADDLVSKCGYSTTEANNLIYRGGLSIYTTQDASIQKICDDTISDDSLFPTNSVMELTYALSVQHKDGSTTNYSEGSVLKYMKKKGLGSNLYFTAKSQAESILKKFKNAKVKEDEGDVVLGEKAAYTLEPQISFSVIDQHTGYVKAIVGGRGEKTASRTLNRATKSTRQPGSTFKVLAVYLPALDEAGMTLATTYVDEPYYYPNGKQVNNWETNTYRGVTTLREAIKRSMNVVTVKVFADVTPQVGYEYLTKLGFTTLVKSRTTDTGTYSDINLSTALGGLTDGVTNLELCGAYSAIANGGTYIKPTFYTKVIDRNGKVLLDNTNETGTRVMKEATAYLLTSAMHDVIYGTGGTGSLAAFQNVKMGLAGKTGTTSNYYDIWFCGFTPYYTACIWSGYDHNVKQSNVTYHKVLWRTIMEKIHKDLPYKDFEMPDSVTRTTICGSCGGYVSDLCSAAGDAQTEYFDESSITNKPCTCHTTASICPESGLLANEYCPNPVTRVFTSGHGEKAPTEYCNIHNASTVVTTPDDGSGGSTDTGGGTGDTSGDGTGTGTGSGSGSGSGSDSGSGTGSGSGDGSGDGGVVVIN